MSIRLRSLPWAAALGLCLASSLCAAEWKDQQRAFKDGWVISKLDDLAEVRRRIAWNYGQKLVNPVRSPKPKLLLDKLDALRAKKRKAAKDLAAAGDGRAVPVLLKAHGKQLKFIGKLEDLHADLKAPWEKRREDMERGLQAHTPNAQGEIRPTNAQAMWLTEMKMLERIWGEVLQEQEISAYTRKAVAKLISGMEGKDKSQRLAVLLRSAGNGSKPEQLEFIRLLGYIAGETVTKRLEDYAGSMNPFVAMAALEALGRQNVPRSIDTLLSRLDDPRWQLRAAALKGLSFFRDARVVEALLERVATEDGVMQRHYFSALNRMVGQSVTGQPGAWKKWWTENKTKVLEAWAKGEQVGPVEDEPPPFMVRSEAEGHTSFYGLKTDSKHIIFVLDVSGSMGEHGGKDDQGRYRIDVAREELKNAIRSLTVEESDERGVSSFNIVAYAADVVVFKKGKMIPATKSNKEKAFKWIDEREAIGATNIFDALEQAFEIIGTRKAAKQFDKGADTIFLMTDGKPNRGRVTDPDLIREEIAKLNRDRKITIHTVGVGEDHADDFLKALATENQGQYIGRGVPPKKKDDVAK